MSSTAAGGPSPAAGAATGPDWGELLAVACRGEGLASAYQPIVDTSRGTVVGYEALARFPGFAEKNPEVWFSAARAHGRSAELESAALRTALAARSSLPTNCFLTVNVSPELLSTEEIRSVWRDEGNLGGLVVELTEQTPIDSYVGLEPDLNQLRAAGALIAVDDAGAGYAGLRHLLALRPSLIKIDRELVQDIDRDEAKRALIEMLGTFAGRVDAWILAEGVERLEELDTLVSLGVPLVQGYCLARRRGVGGHRSGSGPPPRLEAAGDPQSRDSRCPRIRDDSRDCRARRGGLRREPRASVGGTDRRPPAAGLGAGPGGGRVGRGEPRDARESGHPLNEALARSMTRTASSRFEPLLVTDNAGRYAGVARMERMITALAVPGE